MRLSVIQGQIQTTPADAIIVNLFEGVTVPGGATGAVDAALRLGKAEAHGAISQLIHLGDLTGRLNEVGVVYTYNQLPAPRVFIAGLGKREAFTLDRIRQASGSAVRKTRDLGCKRVATIVHGSGIGGLDPQRAAQATVEGALMGSYQFSEHKSQADDRAIEELLVVEYDGSKLDAVKAGARAGEAIARAVNAARSLINRAPNVLYPDAFAQAAREMAAQHGLQCVVLTEAEIAAAGMGGVLAVSQGSQHPPRFVILEYVPEGQEGEMPPLVFIGKGVTFDTGGISIKPSEVLTMMSGLKVEVVSTDAEGRLILADALHYAKRYRPRGVVDLATLTGACVVALGEGIAAGVFSNNDDWCAAVLRAADEQGERMWRLPLYSEYGDKIKSDVADIKNSGGRTGGVGTSAYFLYHFVQGEGEYPWVHVDMAGMTFSPENKGYLVKGAMGYGVRTLVALAQAE